MIRIDQVGGGPDHLRWPVTAEGRSIYWAALNKGKRSVTIDLRRPEGRELATALVTAPGEDAGLFLTNFPGRGWRAYDSLTARRPDLVMVEIKGNRDGSTAMDYTVNAAIGFPTVTGQPDSGLPTNHVLPAWDLITGQVAVTGLLVAERHRRLTGEGQHVEIALSDVALATVSLLGHIGEEQVNDVERRRLGNDTYGAFGRDFRTADGRRVMVVAITFRQWQRLVAATRLEERMGQLERLLGLDFGSETNRYLARASIAALIEPWCAERTLAEVSAALDAGGVCWGPFQSFRQLIAEDPRCRTDNPLFQEVAQPGIGRYLSAGHPADFSGAPRGPVAPAPLLGAHTDEVLASTLDLADRELARLHDAGVIAGPHEQVEAA